ncbi:MAG: excinuclease ABC subunit UvrA [Gemmatimonadetes bacterium]|nr:excinuclease ABC subunit UvrA [Gemmatimonadota bacterium]
METRDIVVRGARVHNLKNISLELPKNKLICFTGVSGSGKSSLAFDTLYAEGQRRYVTSLSAYARQFLGQMEKPDVDQITGLAPTISIAQKTAGQNPRSTVGTITEIYDYLRVLFARVGTPHCTGCGQPIGAQSRDQIVARIRALPLNSRLHILAPVVQQRKGEYHELFDELQRTGYIRVRVDGQIFTLDEAPELDRYSRHNIEVVVDRVVLREEADPRLEEAVDNALRLAQGSFIVARDDDDDMLLSASFDCTACGISYQEPTPQMFSFNNPQGMCSDCSGLGTQVLMSEHLMVPDPSKSIRAGALEPLGEIENNRWRLHLYEGAAEYLGFDLDTPWEKLKDAQKQSFLYGLGDKKITFTYTNLRNYTWSHDDQYEGVVQFLEEKFRGANDKQRRELEQYMGSQICANCHGGRLRPESLAVKIDERNMPQLTSIAIEEARDFFNAVSFEDTKALIAEEALKEIRGRLQLMCDMGLGYLTLDRGAHTLSGGEAQRIRLASQIGSGLVGVLYILDEPSIGLHHRDNERLLMTLKRLRDIGNTVIVVEHDEETMREADLIVDFGPGAGERGGELVVCGPPSQVERTSASITGRYLSGKESIPVPTERRQPSGKWLEVEGARQHNLKNIEARIPLGLFTCITGVSGSGKSSLINDIVFKQLDRELHRAQMEPGLHTAIKGIEHLDKVIRIDQKPIGRTPRSNPATYTDAFTAIRQLFAKLPEARLRDYQPGRFSFNVKGGRCEACEGNGANLVEMEFLADVWVTCEICEGRRFNRETQTVKYKDKSIADILNMEIEEALVFFENLPPIKRVLQTLYDVGLGYIKLGQPAPTLSGGEAQRIKLAKELCRQNTGRTLYILDEPTTGLHFADVDKLLRILHTFADQGNTVVVIEHNMEVIKTADHILDLGPEGGADGGLIIAAGTPEEVAENEKSYTGQALKATLQPTKAKYKAAKKDDRGKNNGWIKEIEILGARQHNLRNIDVKIPRDQMTVISGVSGSGKSSLAFDTLYAEGQRRYVESLSAYARQFLEQMQKPKVERISGLSPAIAIEQKAPSRNPRSTVGTVTEIYDYVRALYATIGAQHCPRCQVPVGAQTAQQMVDRILQMPEGRRILVLAPIEPRQNEGYEILLERARSEGFMRARIDGEVHEIRDKIQLERRHRHQIELVVDRLAVRARDRGRLNESVERALELSSGEMIITSPDDGQEDRLSRRYSCPSCGTSFAPLAPQSFSFNHQQGMCGICEGLGLGEGVDRELIISQPQLSVRDGAIDPWGPIEDAGFTRLLETAGEALGFDLDTPYAQLPAAARRGLLYGAADKTLSLDDGLVFRYNGVLPTIDEHARSSQRHKKLLREVPCSACEGSRLKTDSRVVYLRDKSIVEITHIPIEQSLLFFSEMQLEQREQEVAGELLQEIRTRLGFLERVGLGYINLERRAATLSGGEAQRIRLASQIGSGLTGVLYLLDEPTIGLHPRDNRRLLDALKDLKDLGNTVVLVEHDRETLEEADHIIDLGPGAGSEGGELVATGAPKKLGKAPRSYTSAYLHDELQIPVPPNRRKGNGHTLTVKGARQNNLKNIDAIFPLGQLIGITGVSGSGKSSLVEDVLFNALSNELHNASRPVGEHDEIEGIEHIDKVINIDQTPIGQSPRSTPATVMGIFDLMRQLYADMPESKIRGFTAGRFSFNKPGGRCETCEGLGLRCIEMHFLPDVWVECDNCRGKRYTPEVLRVLFKDHSVADVLEMRVRDSLLLFDNIPRIRKRLQVMHDVGLGYMSLGQSSTTLSGGEAQRLKLAAELCRPDTGQTLYILDEPTTGLHFADIERLLTVLHRLVDAGNTMVVIEHNMDVIKTADHLIDIGLEGGGAGGDIVVTGPPEKVAKDKESHTGRILAEVLAADKKATKKAS